MPGKFELKKARNGEFYFNLKAGNGEVILTSETYKTRSSALNGIASVQKNAPIPERFERKASTRGKCYFVLKAANHQVIGKSETYSSEDARDAGIQSVGNSAPEAATVDLTGAAKAASA